MQHTVPQHPASLGEKSLTSAMAESYPPEYGADPRRLFHTVVERAWIILLCFVVFAALGAAYIHRAPVLYSSTATIQVERDIAPVFQQDAGQFRDLQALDFLQTVVQSLKARPLLERVAASNSLAGNMAFLPPPEDGSQRTPANLINALEKTVSVKLRRGTRLIDITVTHSSPVLAEKIANSVVGEYTSENAERHVTSAEVANESLLKEAGRLRKKLQESENALQAYKEQSKASSLDDRQNTVVAALKELSTKLTEAKSLRIKAESDFSQAQELGTNVEALITLPTLAADPTVVAARLSLSKAEGDFAALRQRYKEKHPKFLQAQTQITTLQNDLQETVLKAARTIEANLVRTRASEAALGQELRAQEAEALDLNKLSIQYSVLVREVESDRALYDSVLKSMKETTVTKELNPVRVRVVQPAYASDKPVSPRKAMILGMSVMAGLCAGFMLVMGIGFLDTSVKTVDDAEAMFQLPVLTTIAQLKEVRRRHHPLVVLEETKSSGAESFRTLRTSLSMLGRVEDRRVFLFTSSLPQEGKTFCSINYAASLAQLGLKILLVGRGPAAAHSGKHLARQGNQPSWRNRLPDGA